MSNPELQLAAQLNSSKGLRPKNEWLSSFLKTQRPTTPFQSLMQTACFRLLSSDITSTLNCDACFPADISNPHVQERKLQGSIPVQILGVEDISKSRWEQIEAIEAIERGEGTRGREIIRLPETEGEDGLNGGRSVRISGMHKLLLQDASGVRAYGIELFAIEGVGSSMNIGSKLLLAEVTVARGTVLMEPKTVRLLGGKIESFHKQWKENRKADLKSSIERQVS